MADDNVVVMPGVKLREPAKLEPVAEVVKMLEEYLERAKKGEIRGAGIAAVNERHQASTQYCSDAGNVNLNGLHTAVAMLNFRFSAHAFDDCVEMKGPPNQTP